MNLLLDTHIALWAITDSPRLSKKARDLILSSHTTVWISAVSLWEIAIKHALSRERMPVSGKEALGYFDDSGYAILPIRPEHAVAVEELPNHHQNPFDRLLIAQALVEPMRLVTHDALLTRYSQDMVMAV